MSKINYAAMSRRAAITAAALAAMATLGACSGGGGAGGAAEGDMAMGAAEGAKVTVVEYASVTCPHCAAWQNNVWADFKTKYVDTNKVRYVFRELPTAPNEIAVAGFAIARCAGADKYFDVVHTLMAGQDEWRTGAVTPRDFLFRVGNGAGLNNQQIQECITDPDALKAADARAQAAFKAGVSGTPAFYVNGTQVITPGGEGASLADLSTAIDAELAK
ncbi:DsbA family protein [Brevundimonas kwangchunensis]|uniref:DsbA family protein n=1 Tax=Brevundimonas kwangchunensis TaxID=322163 RepID=A0ABN1GTR7_9CAUL